jgi:hypothetical protein
MSASSWSATGFILLIALGGCTIVQTAQPVSLRDGDPRQICVVEDPRVFEEFLPLYKAALERKGFSVKLIPPNSLPSSCPFTSTYHALRSWDFVTYMSHAFVVVYRDGAKAGEALYDAPKGGMAMTTRIYESTESKVATMVDQLFPTLPPK